MSFQMNKLQLDTPVDVIAPLLLIRDDEDCDRLIETTEQIGDRIEEGEEGLRPIFEVMLRLIEKYEDEHFTLPTKVTPESMMIHLMEENGHNQSDMQDVAPRPVINMIVNGKRKLTREHIEKLCKKYDVTGEWFYR